MADARSLAELFQLIRNVRVPVIAAVHGRALAGGCGPATACDLVIATRSARFGYPEVKIGVCAGNGCSILRRNLGEKKSFEHLTQGSSSQPKKRTLIGLVNASFAEESFHMAAIEYAARYEKVSASAVAMTKQLRYDIDGLSFNEAVAKGVEITLTPG